LSPKAGVATPRRSIAGRWSLAIRICVSGLLLFYVFHKLRWDDLWGHVRAADPAWMVVAGLCFGIPTLLIGVRWWILLRVQEVRIPLGRILAYTYIAQFFNTFFLGTTGGDVMKVFYIVRDAPDAKVRAGFSILVDRCMGLVVLAAVAVSAALTEWTLFMSQPELRRILWALIGILVLSAAGIAVVTAAPLVTLLAALKAPEEMRDKAASVQGAARQYILNYRMLSVTLLLSVMVHLFNINGGYCLAKALGLNVGFASIGVILATVFIVISLPVTISGHGLREGIFVLMFSVFGVGSSAAIAFSLCYFGVVLAWSLASGSVYLGFQRMESAARQSVTS